MEENIKQQQQQEVVMQNKLKLNKQKLLNDLADQQIQLEKEIEKVQQERDVNRSRLLSYIYNGRFGLILLKNFFPIYPNKVK